MSCWIDYIGIKTGAPIGAYELPPSGLYINSLPGISLESISKISNADQENYLGAWADIQQEALSRFKVDFLTALRGCYKLRRNLDLEAIMCDNKEVFTNAWKYLLGNQLMLFRLHTNRLNRYTTIELEDAQKLLDFYQVEYERAMEQATALADVSEYELECGGGNPERVIFLP